MEKLELSVEENNVANAIYSINEITDLKNLREVSSYLVSRRKELIAQEIKAKKAVLSVGDKVKFNDNKGNELTGRIAKVNRTRANVEVNSAKRDEQGSLNGFRTVTWAVPITLLDLA